MSATDEILADHRAVVEEHGPWVGFNIEVAPGIFTMGDDRHGAAEQNVVKVLTLVENLSCSSVDSLRILDLGAHEGGYALELARAGAEVVAVEGRHEHVAKMEFAERWLDLPNLTIVEGDIRAILQADALGTFDVVLCLGVLYHLPGRDVGPVVRRLGERCERFTVIETQVALKARTGITWNGHDYAGLAYEEDAAHAGAALTSENSLWLTRPSLFNLLHAEGFSTVLEAGLPQVTALTRFQDHLTLVALPGTIADASLIPRRASALDPYPRRHPDLRHPAQSRFWRLTRRASPIMNRLRLRGVFQKES